MAKHTFRPGDVVFHPDYGKGTVEEGYDGELYVDANDPDVDYGPEEDPPDPLGVELTPEWKLVRKTTPEPGSRGKSHVEKMHEDIAAFKAKRASGGSTSATGKIKHVNGRYEIVGTDKWFSTQAKAEAYLAKKAR